MKSFAMLYSMIKTTIPFTIPELAICLLGSVMIGSYMTLLFKH